MTDNMGRQMTYAEVSDQMILAHVTAEAEKAKRDEWAPFGPCPSNE